MPDQRPRLLLVGRDDDAISQRVNPRDLELLVLDRAQEVAASMSMSAGADATTDVAVRELVDAVHDLNYVHAYGGPRVDVLPGGLA